MTEKFLLVTKTNGVTTMTLNRPEKRNAMHGPMVMELLHVLNELKNDAATHVVMINGAGDNFCAGGDIAWMQKIASGSEDDNYEDAQLLADLLYALYTFPKPTIVLVHGATMGGGLGLVSAADIAIAAKNTSFAFPEVKIGITPSMISPYVIATMGERAAHFYFLTGDRFGAEEAQRMHLVHQVTEDNELMNIGFMLAQNLLQNSPRALHAVKQLIRRVTKENITEALAQETAEHLAELRATPEAQEGLRAFLEKRKAQWA